MNDRKFLEDGNVFVLMRLSQDKEYKRLHCKTMYYDLPKESSQWSKVDLANEQEVSGCFQQMLYGFTGKTTKEYVDLAGIAFALDGEIITGVLNTNPAQTGRVMVIGIDNYYRKQRNQNYIIGLGLTAVAAMGLVAYYK